MIVLVTDGPLAGEVDVAMFGQGPHPFLYGRTAGGGEVTYQLLQVARNGWARQGDRWVWVSAGQLLYCLRPPELLWVGAP